MLCWGDDRFGQSDAPPGRFSDASAGAYHTLRTVQVSTDGRLAWWGNSCYQYGQSQTHAGLLAAHAIVADSRFVSIASGVSDA